MARRDERFEPGPPHTGAIALKIILVLLVVIAGLVCIIMWYRKKDDTQTEEVVSEVSEKVSEFVEEEIIGSEGEVVTINEAEIREVFEISELQTAEYIYNAIVAAYDNENNVKYHVSYEGTVTAGIDFENIDIDINDSTKVITLTVPEVTIQDVVVDAGTLDYIFKDDKYDNETVFKEAYTLCQNDLELRAVNEDSLVELAGENARAVVEALVTPWVEQLDADYEVEVKSYEEN